MVKPWAMPAEVIILLFSIFRPAWHTEWHEFETGRDPKISWYVFGDKEADLPTLLLSFQWWSFGNTWTVQKSWSCKYWPW